MTTTLKVQAEVRDALARVAAEDFGGATLSEAVGRLLAEHEEVRVRRQIAAAYARLRSDPQQWRSYVDELDEWDAVACDAGEQR
ncbi:MAG TPA: hypothetical protein VKP11_07100 [Frankiaceae bacterium]|nr:hypothetical protein [Frankiaceae bacterium]